MLRRWLELRTWAGVTASLVLSIVLVALPVGSPAALAYEEETGGFALTHLVFTTPPQTAVAGVTTGVITVQLQTSLGRPVVVPISLALQLKTSSPTGSFRNVGDTASVTSLSIAAGTSIASFRYQDSTPGAPMLTVGAADVLVQRVVLSAVQTETITAAVLDHLVLSPATASIVAGGSQLYTAQGADRFGNSLGDLTASTSFAISPDGGCTGAACTASTAGSHTITGTSAGKTGTASLNVTPGAATTLRLATPATAGAGSAFSVTVTARDSSGNTASGYRGTLHFTGGGVGAVLPADYAFLASDAGVHTFTNGVSLQAAGNQTITATDTVLGTLTGSATVNVSVPAPVIAAVSPNSGPAAGGTLVTISGSHLAGASAVVFGTTPGVIVSSADTQLQALSPINGPGPIDITVTTAGGTSATSISDRFIFVSYATTVLNDGPSLYWRLGESSGTIATDATRNGRTGVYSGGVTLGAVSALRGDSDTSISLDGITGSVQEASGAGLPTGSASRSIEVWFKTTIATSQPLFTYGTPGSASSFGAYVNGNLIQVNTGSTTTLLFTSTAALSDGAWHHLVVTYNGIDTVTVYIDGNMVGAPVSTTALATVLDATGLLVGRDNAAGFLAGQLDEFAVYGTALSPAQVLGHYQAGHGAS